MFILWFLEFTDFWLEFQLELASVIDFGHYLTDSDTKAPHTYH